MARQRKAPEDLRATKRAYQGRHYATVSASIPIEEKVRFMTLCERNGTSMNAAISGFVAQCLGYLSEDSPIGSPENPPIGSPENPPIGSQREMAFATPPVIFL